MSNHDGSRWSRGPLPKDRSARIELTRGIADRARLRFDAVAVGAYGSLARGDDGPFSDIELLCIVAGIADETFEWIHDGWKVQVDVRGREDLLRDASTVCKDWAISHATYEHIMPMHDSGGFFVELADRLKGTPQFAFERALERLYVGELYEAIGKLRNARVRGEPPPPGFLYYVVKIGYWMIGLANRRTYAAATRAMAESLALPERMLGYDELCRMAIVGDVADASRVFEACEAFWQGAAAWAMERGLGIEAKAHLV